MRGSNGLKNFVIGRAKFAYEPQSKSELPLKEGEVIEIFQKAESGWWEGRSMTTGEVGYFPANYVEEIQKGDVVAANEVQVKLEPLKSEPVVVKSEPLKSLPAVVKLEPLKSEPAVSSAKQLNRHTTGVRPKTGFENFQSSPSRYGMWATNMGIGCSIALFWASLSSLLLSIVAEQSFDPHHNELYLNLYGLLISILTLVYETRWFLRTSTMIPFRAFSYAVVAVPLMFTQQTYMVALLYFFVAAVNLISAYKEEQYIREGLLDSPNPGPPVPKLTLRHQIIGLWAKAHKENKRGVIIFTILYTSINIFVGISALVKWMAIVKGLQSTRLALSEYAPFAKMFGNLLDLNCGIILLPVCRTFIRYLYDLSTQSQTNGQKLLRTLLKIFPLDKALIFHKRVAMLIWIFTIGHTFCHFINYGIATSNTLEVFGWWPWISGISLFVVMMFMYGSTHSNVKHFHFELFYNSHQLFVLFFAFLLTHGKGGINPNVWKWLAVPLAIYLAERVYRYKSAYRSVCLTSINNMGKVICIQFDRDLAFPQGYKEGQYLFLNCPRISAGQWHPFTISSAPQQSQVTLHIRVMGPTSWTGKLAEYLQLMMPPGKSYVNFVVGKSKGKVIGPDGKPLLRVYGPHSAPTQHISEYQVDMIIGAGIGVTPVSATVRSIVHHRWKFSIGTTFPEHAYFFWVVSHAELDSFRWFVRVMKDADDAVYNACAKDATMKKKTFEIHVFVTSSPTHKTASSKPANVEDIAYWGTHQEDIAESVEKISAPWKEEELLHTLKNCPAAGVRLGSIRIYNGRPLWDERFEEIAERHNGSNIGVAFCGNPRIGKDLKKICAQYTTEHTRFKLHRENF